MSVPGWKLNVLILLLAINSNGASVFQTTITHAFWLRVITLTLPKVFMVFAEVTFNKNNLTIIFEGKDVRGNAIKKPAIV